MALSQEELHWWAQNAKITVEDGGLHGYLVLRSELLQEEKLPELSFAGLSEFLRLNGITYGIDMVACQQIVMNPRGYIDARARIASGKEQIHGQNAQIEILVDNEPDNTPRVLEGGRVDYFDLGAVRTIYRGQILAKRTPPTEGIAGISVSGATLVAKPGRDTRLPQGKNTSVSADGLLLVADSDGHVSYAPRENKINVFDIFEVKGDVDFSVGNIDFLGSVLIRGSILPGFKVVAAGDIEVLGNVDGATLEAGGDIQIRGGVQMRNQGAIKAGGTVRVRFLQGATAEAGMDVLVRDSIMHSHISAGRNVLMEAQKSVIVGGLVRAGNEIRTRTLGSPMATPTEVEVGVHPHLRIEMAEIHAKLKELHLNIDKTKKALAMLDNMAGQNPLPPDKQQLRQSLSLTYDFYLHEEEELMYRRSEIEAILLDTRQAKVYTLEQIFAGVKLTLGQNVMFVRDPMRGPLFFEISDGEVVARTTSHNGR
ncbi:FapA family protein [Tumebacillus sp. DT12]|uniref:FapA family protein n=1 Tax=Tumebacillus lacus TaxID=2995335 RepID=A0ABT3WV39_9BACL|nr:FapA family protein [Tumebacillus lacus]MCX7568543.1 FapA family protein [Tumebacillus lacus]